MKTLLLVLSGRKEEIKYIPNTFLDPKFDHRLDMNVVSAKVNHFLVQIIQASTDETRSEFLGAMSTLWLGRGQSDILSTSVVYPEQLLLQVMRYRIW